MLNVYLVICQSYTFRHLRNKLDTIKYYTYLQNYISAIISVIFAVFAFFSLALGTPIPEYVNGLRYVATSGLFATSFIYIVFLSRGNNLLSEKDFDTITPNFANVILHYLCPAISFISFVAFERYLALDSGIWTGIVTIPSCVYWAVYLLLTVCKAWKQPYDFSSPSSKKNSKKKNDLIEILTFILIPASFVLISFLIWNVK